MALHKHRKPEAGCLLWTIGTVVILVVLGCGAGSAVRRHDPTPVPNQPGRVTVGMECSPEGAGGVTRGGAQAFCREGRWRT